MPLCIYRVEDQLRIDPIVVEESATGDDAARTMAFDDDNANARTQNNQATAGVALSPVGAGGNNNAVTARRSNVEQALLTQQHRLEQLVRQNHITQMSAISELRRHTDSRIRVVNNNIRASFCTIQGGFALQRQQAHAILTNNTPLTLQQLGGDASILDEVVKPARLCKKNSC